MVKAFYRGDVWRRDVGAGQCSRGIPRKRIRNVVGFEKYYYTNDRAGIKAHDERCTYGAAEVILLPSNIIWSRVLTVYGEVASRRYDDGMIILCAIRVNGIIIT